MIGLLSVYKQRKSQEGQRKEELMPIVSHLTRMLDWYMAEDEKKSIKEILT